MRITLRLDDDVAILLEQVRKATDATLKQVVNDALREGLVRLSSPDEAPAFQTQPVDPGICCFPDLDNLWEVPDETERMGPADDPGRREPAGLCMGPAFTAARNGRPMAGREIERIRLRGTALAIGHGLEFCSTDGDFARFEGLRWVNPLRLVA